MLINKCWVNKSSKQVLIEFADYSYTLCGIRTNKKLRLRSNICKRIIPQTKFNYLPYLSPEYKLVRMGERII